MDCLGHCFRKIAVAFGLRLGGSQNKYTSDDGDSKDLLKDEVAKDEGTSTCKEEHKEGPADTPECDVNTDEKKEVDKEDSSANHQSDADKTESPDGDVAKTESPEGDADKRKSPDGDADKTKSADGDTTNDEFMSTYIVEVDGTETIEVIETENTDKGTEAELTITDSELEKIAQSTFQHSYAKYVEEEGKEETKEV